MDGNIIFQLLTAFILALFAAVFLTVYLYDRRFAANGWFCLAYSLGLASFFFDATGNAKILPMSLLTNTLFWATSGAIVAAGCARAKRPFPLRSFAALVVAGYCGVIYFSVVTPDVIWRSMSANTIAGAMMALCLPALHSNQRRKIDRAVYYTMICAVGLYLVRPLFVLGVLDSPGGSSAESIAIYATMIYLTSALGALALAAVTLIAAGLDILEKLQRDSVTDHLTGLKNQRGFAAVIDAEIAGAGNEGLPGRAILMLDIDRFKSINDENGHAAGDKVLTAIGQTMNELMKYHGTAGRSGGEEFTFLFNKQSSEAAFLISENLRIAIGLLHHTNLPEGKKVTVSMGLAFMRDGESFKRALRRADAALYEAKEGGRNRLKIADGDLPAAGDAATVEAD